MSGMGRLLRRLLLEDRGEDLVEYALLATFIGLSCIVAWQAIEASLGNAYGVFDNSTQNLWIPPDPPSGGSP